MVAAFAIIYFVVDVALNMFAFADGWTIIWPLNGVTVALLLMRPRSSWLWMLLGVEIGTGVGECLIEDFSPGMEFFQRICSAIEVVICAWLLPPCTTVDQWLRVPKIFRKVVVALMLGPGISGVLAAILFHVAKGQPYLVAFNNWATADGLGIAATMPLVLSARSPQMQALFKPQALPRTLLVLGLVFAGTAVVFSVSRYPLVFLLYPLLLLADSQLAFAGSAIAVAGVCPIAMYFTTRSMGPFGEWPADLWVPGNMALQIFFAFHMTALFPASVLFMERRTMAEELRASNARLTVLAAMDGLTGIANRRSFDERLNEEWRRASRLRAPLSIAMIDLDNFKQFNDLYGHVAGDKCLRGRRAGEPNPSSRGCGGAFRRRGIRDAAAEYQRGRHRSGRRTHSQSRGRLGCFAPGKHLGSGHRVDWPHHPHTGPRRWTVRVHSIGGYGLVPSQTRRPQPGRDPDLAGGPPGGPGAQ